MGSWQLRNSHTFGLIKLGLSAYISISLDYEKITGSLSVTVYQPDSQYMYYGVQISGKVESIGSDLDIVINNDGHRLKSFLPVKSVGGSIRIVQTGTHLNYYNENPIDDNI